MHAFEVPSSTEQIHKTTCMDIEKEQGGRYGRTAALGAIRLLQRLKRPSDRTSKSAPSIQLHSNIATGHSIDPISVRLVVSVLYRVRPKREIEPAIARSIAVAATRIISLRSKASPDSVN
jgi:hypothetical protein